MERKICSGAIISDGEKFLFGKRNEHAKWYPGTWDIIGGHAIEFETEEDTMIREVEEELSIVATEYELLAKADIPLGSAQVRLYIFIVTKWLGNIRNSSVEHSEIAWFRREDLNQIELAAKEYLLLLDEWRKRKQRLLD